MPKLIIDGKEIEVQDGMTVMQACEQAGEEIPRFCYHEKLSIAGNCRMCLVEVEKSPKLVASCAMPAAEGMIVHTKSKKVKEGREGVMEFLLINHPLDCPICDQGGECDLQDQAMFYGRGENRFTENKRSVPDKYMGPLIETHMNRCIHCTRCVRFITQIAGVEELGGIGRGEHVEISTYVEKAISSELSGNIIDLCPVGALTSKPFAFTARSWELKPTESIDVLDAVGSNIRIDSKALQVMRILPRANEEINEEWISDKTRFSYDGLRLQRLDVPLIRKDGKFYKATWKEAISLVAEKMNNAKPEEIAALAGNLSDLESMFLLKKLMKQIGSENLDCRPEDLHIDNKHGRSSYLFNSSIAGIESADVCLIIGANPRFEASILGARLRKRFLQGNFKIASIGLLDDQTYAIENLGLDISILNDILHDKHEFCKILKNAKNPMIILGEEALKSHEHMLGICAAIAEKFGVISGQWNGFNILHQAASRVGGLDLDFLPGAKGKSTKEIISACKYGSIKVLYLLGSDEIDLSDLEETFIIYQGHHGDVGAHNANVILPATSYVEKEASFVNLEGRLQKTIAAIKPLGQALEDWKIISMLRNKLFGINEHKNVQEVQQEMFAEHKSLGQYGEIRQENWEFEASSNLSLPSKKIIAAVENYYMTDPISRASRTMSECVSKIKLKKTGA